jgi:hypothetical protein
MEQMVRAMKLLLLQVATQLDHTIDHLTSFFAKGILW